MARRKRSHHHASSGTGLGLTLFLIATVALLYDEYWPWLVAGGSVISVSWVIVWWRRRRLARSMAEIDKMTGLQFERYLVRLFRKLGYIAKHQGGSGDFGADLIVQKSGIKVAVQAKNYNSGTVGNDAVQQAIAGATYHGCQEAMVVTNAQFTKAARQQADKSTLPVILWDRASLTRLLQER